MDTANADQISIKLDKEEVDYIHKLLGMVYLLIKNNDNDRNLQMELIERVIKFIPELRSI
jgi:hypothetical protein